MSEQSKYILEKTGLFHNQISRFGSDGNRTVIIKVESFDLDHEMEFILWALNRDQDEHESAEQRGLTVRRVNRRLTP